MVFLELQFLIRSYELDYDELTVNQKSVTKGLLDYIGLDFDKACLDFHLNTREAKTASGFQVRQKMYQGSSRNWQKCKQYFPKLISSLKDY